MSRVLVTIQYDVEAAKRDAYLTRVRELREHAVETLGIRYDVYEDTDHAGSFTEVFSCDSLDDYEALEERQDDVMRTFVAELDRFTDVSKVVYSSLQRVP